MRGWSLAQLGAKSHTSLLIEAGDLAFLQAPVSRSISNATIPEIISSILAGPERYTSLQRGRLTIVYPRNPATPINRILRLPLGPFVFDKKSLEELWEELTFHLEEKTGCPSPGYFYSGPALPLNIPRISLPSATFEKVVERVANASQASMWIVVPDRGIEGCIEDPGQEWQVGIYLQSLDFRDTVFRGWIGPSLVQRYH